MIKIMFNSLFGLFSVCAVAADLTTTFKFASTTPLANPHDIKLSADKKHLFVSDVDNNRVAILDPQSLALIAEFGSDHQSGTHDIDVDDQGLAYVADTRNNRVTIYRIEGTDAEFVGQLDEKIKGPEGVLAHPNGRIYVAGAWSDNVIAYEDGKVVAELKGLSSPHDLALAQNKNIWLADAGNDRMLLLSADLQILKTLKGKPYHFNGVRYQDATSDGMLVVADKYNHSVKFIDKNGSLVHVIGTGKPGKGPNRFTTPEGIEVNEETLWIADSGNNRIVRYKINLN